MTRSPTMSAAPSEAAKFTARPSSAAFAAARSTPESTPSPSEKMQAVTLLPESCSKRTSLMSSIKEHP